MIVADPTAVAILVPTLVTLDAIASRGAGRMAVIPQDVATVSASEYRGWQFVAWPRANFNAIVQASVQLGYFGEPLISTANTTAAEMILHDQSLQLAFVKGAASTVDEIRTRLRKQLVGLGVQVSPAPNVPKTPSSFPWAWILGTAALGLGLGFLLYTADKRALPGDR
jgi:hypothetical protein